MAKRWRGERRDRGGPGPVAQDAAFRPDAGALRARPVEAALSAPERVWRLVLVTARNAVGLVGLLFFGWSAASLALLYFADTLAGMGALFAALGFKLSNADPRRGFWTLVEGVLSGLAVAVVLVAFIAVPLGTFPRR